MNIRLSKEVIDYLKIQKKKNAKLFKRIEKQLSLFKTNPKHQSLRVHKLTGKIKNMWSISIIKDIRMVYILLENDCPYFVDIGTHDQVYRK
ncbi:MAG: type II toxin-antitoxin system mRNA interferase toxin, RelE/StbE family [Candidatus Roizmanbacteria bacterium]|nr:MAG: type II toxin-antitoxin system mRNA interferase toxin, RelE/StbE family [Candidatus Roizmanbacteria bacterium]